MRAAKRRRTRDGSGQDMKLEVVWCSSWGTDSGRQEGDMGALLRTHASAHAADQLGLDSSYA